MTRLTFTRVLTKNAVAGGEPGSIVLAQVASFNTGYRRGEKLLASPPKRSDLEDRLFLLDSSGSMNSKIGKRGPVKILLAREGLKKFCMDRWPVSYYDTPLRIGIVAFRLLGTPGKTVFEVIIPLYPPPPSIEVYRFDELVAKGGSLAADALRYAAAEMQGSDRGVRRVYFISDGNLEGPDPLPLAEEVFKLGVTLNTVELSDKPSELLSKMAERGGGRHSLVQDEKGFASAIA